MKMKQLLLILAAALSTVSAAPCNSESDGPCVSGISPQTGSTNGATRITIAGYAFVDDLYTGTIDVYLSSATQRYDCTIHQDGCTEIQIMCYTTPMPEDNYYVTVALNGNPVPLQNHCNDDNARGSNCRFTTSASYTPTIDEISAYSQAPGNFIRVDGTIKTSLFASSGEESTNGNTARISRVWVHSGKCDLVDENGDLYDFELDGEDGEYDTGHFVCLPEGTFIGNQNLSYIVNEGYGRSLADKSLIRVMSGNQLAMFETYSVVDSISHSTGSTEGGVPMTITGNHFDNTNSPPTVTVGGIACEDITLSDDYSNIVCTVPGEPDTLTLSGNRGVRLEIWNVTDDHDYTDENINSMSDPDFEETLNIFEFSDTNSQSNSFAVMTGAFVAPSTNTYKFALRADDSAVLYLDVNGSADAATEVARVDSYNYDEDAVETVDYDLSEGQEVYVSVIVRNGGGGMAARVSVHMYDTVYTESHTGQAVNEVQNIDIDSDVIHEVQRITLNDWTTRTNVDDKQSYEISVESDPSQCFYKLGLFGAFTEAIAVDATTLTIKTKLMELPFFSSVAESLVEPTVEELTLASWKFTVGFKNLGDYPLFSLRPVPTEECTGMTLSDVTVEQDGVTSGNHIVPFYNGIPGSPIPKAEFNAEQIQASLNALFSVRCPPRIVNPAGSAYTEDFEGNTGAYTTSEYAPFCGRKAGALRSWQSNFEIYNAGRDDENAWRDGISGTRSVMCFAYRGNVGDYLSVRYRYDDAISRVWLYTTLTSPYAYIMPDTYYTIWNYVCLDLFDMIQQQDEDVTAPAGLDILEVRVYDHDMTGSYPMLIDSISFTQSALVTSPIDVAWYERLTPPWIAESISVEPYNSTTTNIFDVTIVTLDCASDLALISFEFGSGSYSSADSATWTFGSDSMLTVERQAAASPPVTGAIGLDIDGDTLVISADTTAEDLALYMSSVNTRVGDVAVERSGDCRGYDWRIEYTSVGGDHPDLQVYAHSLQPAGVVLEVETEQDGGVHWDPVPGFLTRTHHDQPQVVVLINGIPSLCNGDCSFEWDSAQTPRIDSITPSSGTSGDSVVIDGDGFSSNNAENEVSIGQAACTVTASNSSQITCTVGEGVPGERSVKVVVTTKGLADNSAAVNFTYDFTVSDMTPTTGYSSGGAVVVIEGAGFGDQVAVTIGGNDCPITSSNYTFITCTAPSGVAGAQAVVVSENGVDASGSLSFTYTTPSASITGLSANTANVGGGTEVTISGTGFGTEAHGAGVVVAAVAADITSYADDEIVVALPAMDIGTYTLNVMVDDDGFAARDTATDIEYIFRVDNVYPRQGSLMGGQKLTITGQGFSTTGQNTIKLGDSDCMEESATDTQIICQMQYTTTVHSVTNQGHHSTYGTGYAWSPAHLTIEKGDFVEIAWSIPDTISGVGYRVYQVSSPVSTTPLVGGFISSSIQTGNGVYKYQFTETGTFYYYSGAVTTGFGMWGKVVVTEKSNYYEYLSLSIGHVHAQYDTTSGVADPVDSSACAPLLSVPAGCDEVRGDDSDLFDVAMWECMMPTISAISPSTVIAGQDITITGTGFSTTACQNEVMIEPAGHGLVDIDWDPVQCDVSSATATEIVCSLPSLCEGMPTGKPLSLEVRVNNYGYGLHTQVAKTDRAITLLSSITSLSPELGSTLGGQQLVIEGSNFCYQCADNCARRKKRSNLQDALSLDGGSVTLYETIVNICSSVTSITAERVECTTRSAPGSAMVAVSTQTTDGAVSMSTCSGTCVFTQSSAYTPTLSAPSPTSITANDEVLSFTGTSLGTDADAVSIRVGDTTCEVSSLVDNGDSTQTVTCAAGQPLGGAQYLYAVVTGLGNAQLQQSVIDVHRSITSISPSEVGSIGGALVTISGVGFDEDTYEITVAGEDCTQTTFVSRGQLTCTVPALSDGDAEVVVTSGGVSVSYSSLSVVSTNLPTVTSVSPTENVQGTDVVISGSDLYEPVEVSIGGAECSVHSYSGDGTSLTCVLGANAAGTYSISAVATDVGTASGSVTFTYLLEVDDVSPTSGMFGGGQSLVITGRGFNDDGMEVTVCDNDCVVTNVTTTEITCVTPANTGSGTVSCDVTVTDVASGTDVTSSGAYSYTGSADVTGVEPARGGTGGGTRLTVSGSGFGTNTADVEVTIAGTECVVESVADTEIVCLTGAHSPSVRSQVAVSLGDNGIARQTSADFEYIDVWSSQYTWGGNEPPSADDFVIIPSHMTVLLDESTPVLKLLLIDGGTLIFENEAAADITLQAEVILIVNGGTLQVGTESEPYEGEATIKLHGHVRSRELPIYGTKSLAVRQGTLDLHGRPTSKPWTRLDGSVTAGDSQITLMHAVDWQVGDEIIIATTGHRHSQSENEQHTIASVSGDRRTLTLVDPLENNHLGVDVEFSGQTLEARAEVGLLTRNIRFTGNNDPQWHDVIEACPDGFDSGEFATQTCFQGRFGEEIGSNEFGAQIIMHAPDPSQGDLIARIENVELTFVGQAYRLGRYAIHFHLLGDMQGSYVRSCAIHRSFNRAVNIHATHNVLIEHNVAYNIMGGAMFLEDGVETGNVFEYNLIILSKASSSLQNDDITPAAYWVTNANNTYRHNVAAGGTHFGFWYRMHEHPDGPSFDPNIFPRRIPMGIFQNNTVHSQGWFGIWIFQVFTPVENGDGSSNVPEPAKFYELTAWHCEKGAEWVGGGAIQWHDFFLVNNEKAGIEMKMILQPVEWYDVDLGALISGGKIVAYDDTGVLPEIGTRSGIIMPYARGLIVRDIEFINFVGDNVCYGVTQIDGKTSSNNGGFTYHLSGHTFTNTDNIIGFRWEHEAAFKALDDTLTGTAGDTVVPCTGFLPNECTGSPVAAFSAGEDGCVCDSSVHFHRFSFNEYSPGSLEGKDAMFVNEFGSSSSPFMKKRMTHPFGWMVLLPSGYQYTMSFVNAEHLVNISYSGDMYDFESGDFVILSYEFYQRPDAIRIFSASDPDLANSSAAVTYSDNYYGDFFIDPIDPSEPTNNTYTVMSLVSYRGRDNSSEPSVDRSIDLDVYRCYFENCEVPPDPATLPPSDTRPDHAVMWSELVWVYEAEGNTYTADSPAEEVSRRRRSEEEQNLPVENADVYVEEGTWLVLDVERDELPQLGRIFISGVLEFEWEGGLDLELSATHIVVTGGRLILGWENHPISGSAALQMRGNYYTDDITYQGAANIGSKAVGVFGGLDMHGQEVTTTWTLLESTASAGSSDITLSQPVDWQVGNEIAIASTSYAPLHSEKRTITAVSDDGRTLTLDTPLEYEHIASVEDIGGGETFNMSAEVGLLSRNVRIYGKDYNDGQMAEQGFGGRVLVSTYGSGDGLSSGYARISNVEFEHMGQEGWSDFFDPRYALAFLDTGDVTVQRPSYVKKCVFHDNYNTAFGSFGTNGMVFEDNVVYRTVGSSVRLWDQDHIIRNNLVMDMIYAGTWNDRREFRFSWYALMDITNTLNTTLVGNHLAGGERGGYRVDGEVCGETSQWSDNVVHSALQGVIQLPDEGDGYYPCTYLHGFRTWRTYDFGIFSMIAGSIVVDDHISIEDNIGMYPFVYRPSATSHAYENKYIEVMNSHYVGFSSVAGCTDSWQLVSSPEFRVLLSFSSLSRGMHPTTNRRTGITWPNFSSGPVPVPTKPFLKIMSYQAILGKMTVHDTVMKSYDMRCGSTDDDVVAYAFQASTVNDDAIHPLYTHSMTLEDVSPASIAYIPTPKVGKINPADCVDMDCDGLKKAILADKDGSLFGEPSTVLSRSEFEWDGDPRRGTGDYRIPRTLTTTVDGDRIDIDTSADFVGRGIARKRSQCHYQDSFNAHVCTRGDDYHMLMLESMDSDTETRRVSPIGIVNHDESERYYDLINGPQDHGWCMGYTCQKRLSTFPIILTANSTYELHYTGTSPQHTRFHWLNPEEYSDGNAVVLGVWYSNPYRLDVYVDDEYKLPVNGRYEDGQLLFDSGDHRLDPETVSTGDNWFERATGIQWLALKGDHLVEIKTSPLIFVNFNTPFLSDDEFFGENLIENLASFLDIPEDRIIVATAVSEQGRRRRTSVIQVTLEISNPPHDADVTDPNELSTSELQAIASTIINTYQLGQLDDVLEIEILTLTVTEPLPDPDSEEWQYIVSLETTTEVTVQLPDSLSLEVPPTPQHEGAPFRLQPALRTYDADDVEVTSLGSLSEPWELTAYLFAVSSLYNEAELVGTETVTSSGGWFNFTELGVSHTGTYEIQFMVTAPEGASHLRVTSEQFTVEARELWAMVVEAPNETVAVNETFDVTVALSDAFTRQALDDIAWRGHSWEATIALYSAISFPGQMSVATETASVDASSNTVTFSDISLDRHGRYYMQFHLVSTPGEYDFATPAQLYIDVVPQGYVAPSSNSYDRLTFKFEGSYAEVAYGYEDYFAAVVYNELFDRFMDRASFDNFEVYEGSIMVAFEVTGDDADEVIEEIYELISDGFDVTYNGSTVSTTGDMWVNGEEYGEEEEKSKEKDGEEEDGLPLWAVVLIALACALLVLCLIAFILYHIYSKKRIEYQLRKLEESNNKKRRSRVERRHTVFMNEMEDGNGDYFHNVKGTEGSRSSLDSEREHGDEDLIIPSAAPKATTYIEPPKSDKFDFVNVRPRSNYNPPGRLPSLGADKPRTPDSVVSASGLNMDDVMDGLQAPGTPDFGLSRQNLP